MPLKYLHNSNGVIMVSISRKRVRRYLHYDEYVVDIHTSNYTADDIELIKQVHDSLNFAIPTLLKAGFLRDMQLFLELVGKNAFPLENIAFLLFVDIIRFYSLENASQMRYNKDTYLFWIYGYLLLKGRFLRFMGGAKFKGALLDGSSSKGSFSPNDSKINFVVPCEKSLRNEADSLGMPKVIKPGLIDFMLDSGRSETNHVVLSCDGKLIRRGLTDNSGDIDLQGNEEGPSLAERQERLVAETNLTKALEAKLKEVHASSKSSIVTEILPIDKHALHQSSIELLSFLARRNSEVRNSKLKKEFTIRKIMKTIDNPDWRKSRYCHLISHLRYDCSKIE